MDGKPEEKEQKRPVDDNSADPAAQRPKREWLAAPQGGRRQPRIGNDFQVSALPLPQSNSGGEDGKEEPKKDEETPTAELETKDESGEVVKESEAPPPPEEK